MSRNVKTQAHTMDRPGIGWALPGIIFFAIFAIVPLGGVVFFSFTSWDGLGAPQFAGLSNWTKLVGSEEVWRSVGVMLLLLVLSVVLQGTISLLLGVWAAGPQLNRAVLSAVFFLPLVFSGAAVAVLWRQLLDPNFGLPGQVGAMLGITVDLMGSATGAIAILTVAGMWQFIPFHILLYQGATRRIPAVLYQAAELDGAGRIRQFFHVTLPQLRNTIITSMIFIVVGGFTAFDMVLILTNGGPGRDTTTTPFLMYVEGFSNFNMGYGSAIAVILVILATTASLILVKTSGYDRMESTQEGL